MSEPSAKVCKCCATRGGLYQTDCAGCVARRTARCPKVVRQEVYAGFVERMGIDALDDFKAAVKAEWELDQHYQRGRSK